MTAKKDVFTREEWLARCATVFDAGLAQPAHMRLMRDWLDALMRYEHTQFSDGQGQGKDWLRFLQHEFERTEQGRRTLANDRDGYALQQIAAILCHPCQRCAEDKGAWHTRPGFCDHKSAIK